MTLKSTVLVTLTALCATACVVAPPHLRYAQAGAAISVVPSAPVYAAPPAYAPPVYAPPVYAPPVYAPPVYAPPAVQVLPPAVYYAPAPPVYINPWLVPNIGLNFWWGRQWGGNHHYR